MSARWQYVRRLDGSLRALFGPVVTIVVATFLVQVALASAPGDPAASLAGSHATPKQIAVVRHELGLDEPLLVRYWDWLSGAMRGDFGVSILSHDNVSSLISARVGTTLFLVVYAAILILAFGIGSGILGGISRAMGPVVASLSGLAVAVPAFVVAQLLINYLSLELGWFPVVGAGDGFADRIWHLTLPAIALSLALCAYAAQITRTAIREEASREHVETARGRGLPPGHVFRRHVLRNAALPILTISGISIAGLIAGTVVVESAFGLDGIGSLLVKGVEAKDYNVVQAITLILVVVFVIATSLVDLLQRVLDPRTRLRKAVR
ncbi:ABC transporter permease [Streptomyces sp. NPDC096311]|uniref:ABC transporter permease n=1 Tax=Streptomyces sp. NPDC096311 TaxID=3366083 RepID=UPI00382251B9